MPRRWSRSEAELRKQTNGRPLEALIGEIARRQRGLIRLEQLTALGLTQRAVQHRARSGRLHRVHRGVYAVHPPPFSSRQRWLAATLACGPRTAISDGCAAAHLGMTETLPTGVHVTNATGAGRALAGVTVHRRRLAEGDVLRVDGILTTSAARTIIDCAHVLGPEGTEELILAADSLRILRRGRLEQLASEHRGRPGIRHVLALIADDPAELRSANERRMFSICREFGVPRPLTNHPIETAGRRFYADFCWPTVRLIVEADSWRWHGGRLATESDRSRDQLLSMAGWRVVRFTRDQIARGRAETGRRLRALTQPQALASASQASSKASSGEPGSGGLSLSSASGLSGW